MLHLCRVSENLQNRSFRATLTHEAELRLQR